MSYASKNIFSALLILILWEQNIAAQPLEEHSGGGRYLKRMEYNLLAEGWQGSAGLYNTESKTAVEKLFFGVVNAKVEFFVEPSFEGAYGFRIVKDSSDAFYWLELKRIGNFKEVYSQLSREYPGMYEKQREERLKRYRIDAKRFLVKNDFAEKLHSTVSKAIDRFKGKGIPPVMVDGYSFTLRCVVEDEVWTLAVHEPRGYMADLANLLNQIVRDAEAGSLDEQKYTALLNNKFKKLENGKDGKSENY